MSPVVYQMPSGSGEKLVLPAYPLSSTSAFAIAFFACVAVTSSIEILTILYQAPRANAIYERFLGRVRRECLAHLLILNEKQLHRALHAYAEYFNRARPHQSF